MKTKKSSQTERLFFSRIERLKSEGHEVTIKITPADKCFGESISASVFHVKNHNAIYLAWTLRRSGGICAKRTSVKRFAMLNGEKADFRTVYRYL